MIHATPVMNCKVPKTHFIEMPVVDEPYATKAVLHVLNHTQIIQKFPLRETSVTLGSALTNTIQLHDPYASAKHCIIEYRDGDYFIKDAGSTNGTWVNDLRVQESELTSMSYIQLGKTTLQFLLQPKHKSKILFHGMITKNLIMHHLFGSLERIAASPSTVIIFGETGTGKELVARAIHKLSPRRRKPWITINCAAIPKELIESELFGHVKGAFTGADRPRPGHFLAAHGGTLFLDEIGEMPLELQPKLLRVLEQKELRPLGSEKIKKVDVRIIAATHRDLGKMVQRGEFREDLYYRLNLVPIHLPPLRDRKDDISVLSKFFLNETRLTPQALKLLLGYQWPGNIRELKNILDRAKLLANGLIVTDREISKIINIKNEHPFTSTLHSMEREMICEFLERYFWNRSATARSLGIPKSTLFDKMKRYNLVPPTKKERSEKKVDYHSQIK